MNNLTKILEGILFVSGDGISKGQLIEKLSVLPNELEESVLELEKKYNSKNSGINLITFNDKIQLCSNPNFAQEIANVLNPIREKQLTKTTLETMAIIAYKQPVTRLEIEEIRGVNSDYAIQTLLGFNLIEVVGRKDALGKPLLFGTTDEFLKRFQLSSIQQLPSYEELLTRINVMESTNDMYDRTDYTLSLQENSKPIANTEPFVEALNEQNKVESIENVAESELIIDEKPAETKETEVEKLEEITEVEKLEEITEVEKLEEITEVEKPEEIVVQEQENIIELQPKKKTKSKDNGSLFEISVDEQGSLKIEDDLPDFLQNEKNIQIIE